MTSALEGIKPISTTVDQNSSPRISFSAEFLDDRSFVSITPSSPAPAREEKRERHRDGEFEFLSNKTSSHSMLSADELFFDGKLLPFWGMEHAEKFSKITLNGKGADGKEEAETGKDQKRGNWFIDDDPSPRPPKCTVLWKELLRLKKQRASSLSPSPSTSSSSSSSSSSSVSDSTTPGYAKEWPKNKEKQAKRIKKGLERPRSTSIRIRPMVNVPICTQVKSSRLPPLFSLKNVRTDRSENGS